MDHPTSTTEAVPSTSSTSLNDPIDCFDGGYDDGRCMASRLVTGIDGATGFIAGDRLSSLWMHSEMLGDALGVDDKELSIFTTTVNGMAEQSWRSVMNNGTIDAIRTIVALNIMESYCDNHPEWIHDYPRFPYSQFEMAPVDGSALIRIALDLSYLRKYAPATDHRIGPFLNAGLPSSRRGKTGPIPLTDAILAHVVRFVESIHFWTHTHFDDRLGRMRNTRRRI